MKKGKLIVIDGLDGCGKSTQFELAETKLKSCGHAVKSISFPDYNNPSSSLVKMYLNGEFSDNPDDVNISYRDNIRNNEIAKITGAHTSNDPNKLVMHLFEPEVSAHSSTRDLLNMTDKDGIPKVLSDINYMSHEMGHAFEHILKAQNPSYIDYGALKIEKNFKRSA